MNRVIEAVNHTHPAVKIVADVGAVGFAWGAFFTNIVPLIATTLSVVWLTLQIYTWFINKKWIKVKDDERTQNKNN